MKGKTAYLIINPRAGQNVEKLSDVLAVLSAAGWRTTIAIKEYGGHALELARAGAEAGHDLVIAYGGDGTLNQVVNGVLTAKGHRGIVGVIPGGTANVWASELGLPKDPVHATLTLVNSAARKVDIGRVGVESLTFLAAPETEGDPPPTGRPKRRRSATESDRTIAVKSAPGAKRHFLLMAGLGIDAAIMGRVSTPLKEKVGAAAVALAAAEELPGHHAFPVEVRSSSGQSEDALLWKGEGLQVVIGNTRRYGNVAELTPDALIDDGVLDVCVVTAGDPLTTMQQIVSFVFHRSASNAGAEHFRGEHLSISVPASIDLQLDGSVVALDDYLRKPDQKALRKAGDRERVMVRYGFDALPRALRVAIPCAYDDALFEEGTAKPGVVAGAETAPPKTEESPPSSGDRKAPADRRQAKARMQALTDQGRKVTVVGTSPNPARKGAYVVAGSTTKKRTGESKPVAVRIDPDTSLVKKTGESLPAAAAKELREGEQILVLGRQTKRGVIRATRVLVGPS
jgi:diacylglycerol kinase family enzyme